MPSCYRIENRTTPLKRVFSLLRFCTGVWNCHLVGCNLLSTNFHRHTPIPQQCILDAIHLCGNSQSHILFVFQLKSISFPFVSFDVGWLFYACQLCLFYFFDCINLFQITFSQYLSYNIPYWKWWIFFIEIISSILLKFIAILFIPLHNRSGSFHCRDYIIDGQFFQDSPEITLILIFL